MEQQKASDEAEEWKTEERFDLVTVVREERGAVDAAEVDGREKFEGAGELRSSSMLLHGCGYCCHERAPLGSI